MAAYSVKEMLNSPVFSVPHLKEYSVKKFGNGGMASFSYSSISFLKGQSDQARSSQSKDR